VRNGKEGNDLKISYIFVKKKVKIIFLSLLLLLIFFSPFFPIQAKAIYTLKNPLTGKAEALTIPQIIGLAIKAILGLVGSIALLMFIIGGLTWMTSGGNPEKIEKGKKTLVWATIGLLVIFSSYIILDFVIRKLTTVTGI